MARLRGLSLTLSLVLVAVSLSACTPAPQFGQMRSVDGGTEIVVPALWADSESQQGGIEPATVWVDSRRSSDTQAYQVNLADVRAKGGGAQWQAATSSAAALGTLFSGLDPDDVACKFDITGPIDGPSAGALLTIGVLAALNKQPLNSKTTMTGTISPDGSIGPVGLVGPKLQAAADAGFTTVVLPAMLTTVIDPASGAEVDTVTFAHSLGIEVQFVRSIAEAYSVFAGTNQESERTARPFKFADYPALDLARTRAAEAVQADIEARLGEHPEAPSLVTEELEDSQAALKKNDPSTAFALAVDSLDELERWHGRVAFETAVKDVGVAAARAMLSETVRAQRDRISAQIDDTTSNAALSDPAKTLALPGCLAWLTYGRAILISIERQISGSELDAKPEVLANYAALAYQVIAEAETVFPSAIGVLEAVPVANVKIAENDDTFISGYTNFLVDAGDANLTYLRDVFGLSEDDRETMLVTDLVPVAFELAAEAQAITSGPGSAGDELEESSIAMTYYVTTMSLIASLQVLGGTDLWLDRNEASVGGLSFITQSINVSHALVADTADELLTSGLNAGFPVWSADWGTVAYTKLSQQDRTAVGSSIALNELWFDAITVLSMQAYVTPDTEK